MEPVTKKPQGIPTGKSAACKNCGARIVYLPTALGKVMPIDAETSSLRRQGIYAYHPSIALRHLPSG